MEQVRDCIDYIKSGDGNIEDILRELSQVLSSTGQNEEIRAEMAQSVDIWGLLTEAMHHIKIDSECLRVARGLVLLSRNLIISCSERSIVSKYFRSLLLLKIDSTNLNVAILQFLVNSTSSIDPVKVEDNHDVKEQNYEYDYNVSKGFLVSFEINDLTDENAQVIYLTYLNNLFNSSEFLYNLLNDEELVERIFILLNFFNTILIQDGEQLNNIEILVLSLFQKIYLHESFIKFWNHIGDSKRELELLNNAQIILTNKENFDEFEITILLSWLMDLYDQFSPIFITSLKQDQNLYLKIFKILDIITNLGKFNHARDFLNHYKFLSKIGPLLQTLETNFERQTLKEINNDVELPGLKTLAIEIITYLIYQNFENQEFMRQQHLLEIILNNCQLDKNEPFIKERAVVCLKYLLEKNQLNQDFVTALQPEKVQIDDEGKLEQMGIELDIDKNGKIQVHNKNTDKIKELK